MGRTIAWLCNAMQSKVQGEYSSLLTNGIGEKNSKRIYKIYIHNIK